MKQQLSTRFIYLLGFLFIAACLTTASYLEKHAGLIPCQLCEMQQILLGLLGCIFCFGLLFRLNRFLQTSISTLATLVATAGLVFAARQVWLQHLPIKSGMECGANLQYLMTILPIQEVIKKVFEGGAACAEVTWRFLSLSLAEWSVLTFSSLTLVSLYQLLTSIKKR